MTSNLPAPIASEPARPTYWRSTLALRTALAWLLAADALSCLFVVVARLHRVGVIDDFRSLSATAQDGRDADHLVSSAGSVQVLILFATAAVFIVWQWRSAKNNELLGKIRPRYTPGWSIGGWFIPFANLAIPLRIFQDLWQGADPDTNGYRDWHGLRRSGLVSLWWTAYLIGNVVSFTSTGSQTLDDIRAADQRAAVGFAITGIAALLAIFVVRSVTDRQDTARGAPRTSRAADAGWYADPTGRFDHRYWNGSMWTLHASRAGATVIDPLN
jgi:Domain of unknown function (DUF4328)/Protein of unknown function (DUF2510)